MIYAGILVCTPNKFLDPVAAANIRYKVKKGGVCFIVYRVRFGGVACNLDRNCAVIVCGTRTAPRTILFFAIHTEAPVVSDPVITGRLTRRWREDSAQRFNGTLPDRRNEL